MAYPETKGQKQSAVAVGVVTTVAVGVGLWALYTYYTTVQNRSTVAASATAELKSRALVTTRLLFHSISLQLHGITRRAKLASKASTSRRLRR